jgi:hypothetical protein
MSNTIKDIKLPYFSEGVIRTAQINDTVCPVNSVQLALNMNFDSIGSVQTRLGAYRFTIHTPTADAAIQSIGNYSHPTYGDWVFYQKGLYIYSVQSFGLASYLMRTLTLSGAITPARYSQFLGRIWMVNGNNGDDIMTSLAGAEEYEFDTTDVPATFPKADYIDAGFDNRVWTADASKGIVYYTDRVQSTDGATYVSPLTFTLTTNFISISPQDGDTITGFCRIPRCLLLFKRNSIYRIFAIDNVDPYPAYNIGTFSQESIVKTKDGVYFHHPSGFYKFNYDGQPTEISRRIIDFVKAASGYSAGVKGSYDGYDNIKWSIGASIIVDGVTYNNCVFRYTISTQVWTIYSYGYPITALTSHKRAANTYEVAAMTVSASVVQLVVLDSGSLDIDKPIPFEFIDRWRSFTDMYSKAKSISGIMVMADNGSGASLQYQTEKNPVDKWDDLGKLDEKYDTLLPNASTRDFNNVRLRIKGYTSGNQMKIHGIEILSIQEKGFNNN